ncbi:PhoH family protein [Vibrio rarus]|uniref:PhoH family protein n=1 Tax=Vibrio rarus TaxID=413403 RepID=UPI0021C3A4B1|nr:PhoH family protein [Vibrio rarus]
MSHPLMLLDTNVFINHPDVLNQLGSARVAVSLEVLRELDNLKVGGGESAYAARQAVRNLALIMTEDNELGSGSLVYENPSNRSVVVEVRADLAEVSDLKGDDKILAELELLASENSDLKPRLFTYDLNLRLRATSMGVPFASESEMSFFGYSSSGEGLSCDGLVVVKDDFWGGYDGASEGSFYVMTIPESYRQALVVGCYIDDGREIYNISRFDRDTGRAYLRVASKKSIGTISARDDRQRCAFDALSSDDVDLVILTGGAGSGKTILSVAHALSGVDSGLFGSLRVLKNKPPLVEEDGFLPGEMNDKLIPYVPGVVCAVAELGYDLEGLIESESISFTSINTIRGASWYGSEVVLIEEAQNLTPKAIKAILTRLGVGVKCIITGNLSSSQIDHKSLGATTNGLARVVDSFADYEGSVHIQLQSKYRGGVAAHAEECL